MLYILCPPAGGLPCGVLVFRCCGLRRRGEKNLLLNRPVFVLAALPLLAFYRKPQHTAAPSHLSGRKVFFPVMKRSRLLLARLSPSLLSGAFPGAPFAYPQGLPFAVLRPSIRWAPTAYSGRFYSARDVLGKRPAGPLIRTGYPSGPMQPQPPSLMPLTGRTLPPVSPRRSILPRIFP